MGTRPARGVSGQWPSRLAAGVEVGLGRGGSALGEAELPHPAAAILLGGRRLGTLGGRCSAPAGAPGGRAFLPGETHPPGCGALPRGREALRRRGAPAALVLRLVHREEEASLGLQRDFGPSEACGPLTVGVGGCASARLEHPPNRSCF